MTLIDQVVAAGRAFYGERQGGQPTLVLNPAESSAPTQPGTGENPDAKRKPAEEPMNEPGIQAGEWTLDSLSGKAWVQGATVKTLFDAFASSAETDMVEREFRRMLRGLEARGLVILTYSKTRGHRKGPTVRLSDQAAKDRWENDRQACLEEMANAVTRIKE